MGSTKYESQACGANDAIRKVEEKRKKKRVGARPLAKSGKGGGRGVILVCANARPICEQEGVEPD